MRFFPTFFGAFYSPETYYRVRYAEKGWGLLYAFILVAITTFIGAVLVTAFLYSAALAPRDGKQPLLDRVLLEIGEQLPALEIADGKLTVNESQPVVIRLTDAMGEFGEVDIATIDTSGAITHRNMQTPMLITRSEMIVKKERGETEIRDLSELLKGVSGSYNRTDLQRHTRDLIEGIHAHAWKMALILVPIVWAVFCVAFFISRVVMLLVLGLAGIIANAVGTPRSLTYMDSVRMAALAYTPVAVFNTVAYFVVMQGASTFVLLVLGAILTIGAIKLTNPKRAA